MGPTYEIPPMDMGAANEGILTDRGQYASFSGEGSGQGHSEGPWGGAEGPCWDQVFWASVSPPSHSLESSVLGPSAFCPFSFSDHLETSDLESSCIMIPFFLQR